MKILNPVPAVPTRLRDSAYELPPAVIPLILIRKHPLFSSWVSQLCQEIKSRSAKWVECSAVPDRFTVWRRVQEHWRQTIVLSLKLNLHTMWIISEFRTVECPLNMSAVFPLWTAKNESQSARAFIEIFIKIFSVLPSHSNLLNQHGF
jgi:hypothetical protein